MPIQPKIIFFKPQSLRQFVQIRLNSQTILESTDKKKELHVISVEEYTDVIENLQYILLTNQMKQSGSRWHSCGTPDVTLISLETASPILIFWILLDI
jgi:hypothetical protein